VPSVPTFGRNCSTVSVCLAHQFEDQQLKGQGHQAHQFSHTSCAISSKRQGLRTSNLVYGWRTTTRISHRRHDFQGQRSRSRDQFESSWPNDVPVSLEAGGGIPCRPNPAATFLVESADDVLFKQIIVHPNHVLSRQTKLVCITTLDLDVITDNLLVLTL